MIVTPHADYRGRRGAISARPARAPDAQGACRDINRLKHATGAPVSTTQEPPNATVEASTGAMKPQLRTHSLCSGTWQGTRRARWRPGDRHVADPRAARQLVGCGDRGWSLFKAGCVPVAIAGQMVEVRLPPGMADPVKDCPGAREQARCSDRHAQPDH